jgi:uncharacterized membrane protein
MKKIISFSKWIGFIGLSFILPLSAHAFTSTSGSGGTGAGPAQQPSGNTAPPSAGITSVQSVLNSLCVVFDYAFWFLIALAVVFGVVAAFRYLTSAGEPEKVKKATSTILYAAIAIGVALLARAIPLIVASFFGASSLTSC